MMLFDLPHFCSIFVTRSSRSQSFCGVDWVRIPRQQETPPEFANLDSVLHRLRRMKIHRLILLPLCAATVVGCGDEQQIAKAIGVPAELFIRLSIEENLRAAGLKYTVEIKPAA